MFVAIRNSLEIAPTFPKICVAFALLANVRHKVLIAGEILGAMGDFWEAFLVVVCVSEAAYALVALFGLGIVVLAKVDWVYFAETFGRQVKSALAFCAKMYLTDCV